MAGRSAFRKVVNMAIKTIEYEVNIAGESVGIMKTNLGGKLSLSVELQGIEDVDIKVEKK